MPFFEIGGMIYETTYRGKTKGLDPVLRTGSDTTSDNSTSTLSNAMMKKLVRDKQPELPGEDSESPSIWKDEWDFWQTRAGSASVGTGVKIGRAALAISLADGPLPVGDVIAAGFLIGGGIYLIGSGMDWW